MYLGYTLPTRPCTRPVLRRVPEVSQEAPGGSRRTLVRCQTRREAPERQDPSDPLSTSLSYGLPDTVLWPPGHCLMASRTLCFRPPVHCLLGLPYTVF